MRKPDTVGTVDQPRERDREFESLRMRGGGEGREVGGGRGGRTDRD